MNLLLFKILTTTQGLPEAPDPETQAEAILFWVCGFLLAGLVAQFVLNQRIHHGHKAQLRELEQASREAFRKHAEASEVRMEKVSDRLFTMMEATNTATGSLATAVTTLAADVRHLDQKD